MLHLISELLLQDSKLSSKSCKTYEMVKILLFATFKINNFKEVNKLLINPINERLQKNPYAYMPA